MKTFHTFILTVFVSLSVLAQAFEGKISYTNSYKSKNPQVTDAQFTSMMGNRQDYFIKGGDYKAEGNGTLMQWQLYVNKDNKLYTKVSHSPAVLWNDGAEQKDSVIKVQVNKGKTEILGYKCDEIILTCKSGIQKYYFNPKLAVDAKLFTKHKFGNWHEFVSRSNALPLKIVIDNEQFGMESTATEVKPMKLESSLFALPQGIKTEKSPY